MYTCLSNQDSTLSLFIETVLLSTSKIYIKKDLFYDFLGGGGVGVGRGYSDVFLHTYMHVGSGHYFFFFFFWGGGGGVKILNFNIFWVFRKMNIS